MKNKSNRLLYTLEVLLGVILMGGVFLIAVHVDVRSAKRTLTSTVSYIKEQCNQYERLNLASETKSMMRIIESVHQINHALTENGTDAGAVTTEMLEQWARDSYVTGVLLLDENGKVQVQYGDPVDGLSTEELSEHMTSDALQDAILFSEKTYAMRFPCEDGSYADLAATGNADGSGMVVAYYHTTLEYTRAFHLSVDTLLVGYNLEQDGTIVVSSGKEIIASNNETLIGKSTDDVEILRKIKEAEASDKLIHARSDTAALSHNYGLMEHGRDYYVYAYLPESDVFDSTIPSVMFSIIVYVIILAIIHMVRWKMAQNYREKQLSIQRQYNEQLQSKNEQLKQAVDQADRANVAKTSFLSRMSHDIRTPINGIAGMIDIIQKNWDDKEKLDDCLRKLRLSTDHLQALVNDVLEVNKISSGKMKLGKEPFNLEELMDEVSALLDIQIKENGITHEKHRIDLRHVKLIGSPLHLRQILINLLSNSIKYNKENGHIDTYVQEVKYNDTHALYEFKIVDTGIGMSKEFIANQIYKPFTQEKTDARTQYKGTGLGMSIVRGLIDKMHGSIKVKSVLGEGSVFIVQIPFELDTAEYETDISEKEKTDKSLKGLHVLLVEDNDINMEVAQFYLEDAGATVEKAWNGQEAVDMVSKNCNYDVILMDLMMPVMDGMEAARRIRKLETDHAKNVPILAMTAQSASDSEQMCKDAGMNGYVAKPVAAKLLTIEIRKAMQC